MKAEAKKYGFRFTAWNGLLFIIAAGLVGSLWGQKVVYFCGGFGLSFLFSGSNFFMAARVDMPDFKRFLTYFIASFVIRFLTVIIIFFFVIKELKEGQIFFTISFIISYICHSVIEIIFMQKILASDIN